MLRLWFSWVMPMEMDIVFNGGKKIEARWDNHVVATDQPSFAGGENSAPAPFFLFLASLGTCAAAYVQGFCEARQIDTKGIQLKQRMIHDASGQKVERIEIDVQLPPEFPEKYEKAVLRVAGQCAVKKVLVDPPEVVLSAVRP